MMCCLSNVSFCAQNSWQLSFIPPAGNCHHHCCCSFCAQAQTEGQTTTETTFRNDLNGLVFEFCFLPLTMAWPAPLGNKTISPRKLLADCRLLLYFQTLRKVTDEAALQQERKRHHHLLILLLSTYFARLHTPARTPFTHARLSAT